MKLTVWCACGFVVCMELGNSQQWKNQRSAVLYIDNMTLLWFNVWMSPFRGIVASEMVYASDDCLERVKFQDDCGI